MPNRGFNIEVDPNIALSGNPDFLRGVPNALPYRKRWYDLGYNNRANSEYIQQIRNLQLIEQLRSQADAASDQRRQQQIEAAMMLKQRLIEQQQEKEDRILGTGSRALEDFKQFMPLVRPNVNPEQSAALIRASGGVPQYQEMVSRLRTMGPEAQAKLSETQSSAERMKGLAAQAQWMHNGPVSTRLTSDGAAKEAILTTPGQMKMRRSFKTERVPIPGTNMFETKMMPYDEMEMSDAKIAYNQLPPAQPQRVVGNVFTDGKAISERILGGTHTSGGTEEDIPTMMNGSLVPQTGTRSGDEGKSAPFNANGNAANLIKSTGSQVVSTMAKGFLGQEGQTTPQTSNVPKQPVNPRYPYTEANKEYIKNSRFGQAYQAGLPSGQPGSPTVFNIPEALKAFISGKAPVTSENLQQFSPQSNQMEGPQFKVPFKMPQGYERSLPLSNALDDVLQNYDDIPAYLNSRYGNVSAKDQGESTAPLPIPQTKYTSGRGGAYQDLTARPVTNSWAELAKQLEDEKFQQQQSQQQGIPNSQDLLRAMMEELYRPTTAPKVRPMY